MASHIELGNGPIAAPDSEQLRLGEVKHFLESALSSNGLRAPMPRLVGPDGEEVELPESLFRVLLQVVDQLAQGKAVTVVPVNKELTTQEAADILNVSRPYLVKLLEQGEIPFVKTGTHRRIRFGDLMAYKQQRDAERERALDYLARLNQEMGLYDL